MGELARIANTAPADYSGAQLKIIRANNPDLEPAEFDTLVELAKATNLSLFRRQLSAIVFSKSNKAKRRVAFVIGIDGYRAMADRTGSYCPSSQKPEWETCPPDPLNPAGLISCTVYVKKFAHGQWHEYSATAHWSEFAPVEQEWAEAEDGKRKPTGKKKLADNWAKMPRVMLSKVAEAQALRRGWPDTLAGIYTEEEVEREKTLDLTATEIVEEVQKEERQRRVGGANSLTIDWLDGSALALVPEGQFADKVVGWARIKDRSSLEIRTFRDRNKHALRQFWAAHEGDALALKTELDTLTDALAAKEAKESA